MQQNLKIVAPLPSLAITGGIRRFLEIGNELVRRGFHYSVVLPEGTKKELTWFRFEGKIKNVNECLPQEFDIAIIGPPDCLKYDYLAKKVILIAIHNASWVIEPYRKFLKEHPETPVVLVNRKLVKFFPQGKIIEGGVNIQHFTPKKLRVGYHAQYAHSNIKGTRYIIEQLSNLPHIELVPIRNIPNDQLPEIYRSLDYFVSWESEGAWNNTAAEALACGVPVVTNGVNCEPFRDKVIVVNNLREFFDCPLKELSYERFVDKLLEVFKTVLSVTDQPLPVTMTEPPQLTIPELTGACHHVLKTFVVNFQPKRYLEIGVGQGENLRDLNVPEKVGIDIVAPDIPLESNIRFYCGKSDDVLTSPEFRKEQPFDLIFIDAFHEFRQCVRDFENALNFLSENGIIVIHDVWPFDQTNKFPYPITGKKPYKMNPNGTWSSAWCGDVWKMVFYLNHKKYLEDFNYATIRAFPGYLVIWRTRKKRQINEVKSTKEIDRLNDNYAIQNETVFNFMSLEEIVTTIMAERQMISDVSIPIANTEETRFSTDNILLAAPTFHEKLYCWQEYLEAIKSNGIKHMLFVDTSPPDKGIPVPEKADVIRLFGMRRRLNSREVLAYAYSVIFSYAQGYGYDYLWIVETDIIVQPDTLRKLLRDVLQTQGIVSALSFRQEGRPQAYYDQRLWKARGRDGLWRIIRQPLPKEDLKGLKKVKAVSFGCLLIPKHLYQYLHAEWSSQHYNHPDGFFFERLAEEGVDVYVDCDIRVKHLQRPWKEVIW